MNFLLIFENHSFLEGFYSDDGELFFQNFENDTFYKGFSLK